MSASWTSASHLYLISFFCFFPEGVACPGVLKGPGVCMTEAGVEFPFLGLNANLDVFVGVLGVDSGGACFRFFALFRDVGRSLSTVIS